MIRSNINVIVCSVCFAPASKTGAAEVSFRGTSLSTATLKFRAVLVLSFAIATSKQLISLVIVTMGTPRSTISTRRLPDPDLLLPISKDKLTAAIAEVPGLYS
jgi:hypothetical protein